MTELFELQMDAIFEAYMYWSESLGADGFGGWTTVPTGSNDSGQYAIRICDIFCKFVTLNGLRFLTNNSLIIAVKSLLIGIQDSDQFILSSLVCQGLMPCSPLDPSVAISIRALEVFCVATLCMPLSRHSVTCIQ